MGKLAVIVANGEFPQDGGEAMKLLVAADFVVACDGAADSYFRHFSRYPNAVVGDLDSVSKDFLARATCEIVAVENQDTNDLEKAVQFCRERYFETVVVVGAGGKRPDHAIGNVFRALELRVPIIDEHGAFVPIVGSHEFRAPIGTAVSVFAPDSETVMTSNGLKWALNGVKLVNLYCATLNRTTAETFSVNTTRPVILYIDYCNSADFLVK